MDKKPHIKPYLYGMLAGFGAISLSILFFFFIYRFDGFGDAVSKVTGILMPFIYGAVIAYLLKPVCNTVENFLHRLFPEKMKGLVSALSVAATLLFGLLVIYALFMMIIPQLVTSVTTLYYTARANLSNFIRWVNNLEFVADNEVIMDYVNKAYNAISVDLDSWIKNTLMPSMQNIVSGVGIGVLNVVTVFKNLIIGIIVAIYLLASRKKFTQQSKLILYSILKPRWADAVLSEVLYADKMFGGFINGKIMDSAIIGVLCYIVCAIVKFPSALLVSVIIGVTNVIPFFGPFIGAVPATLLILIQNPIKALWFVLFILILQQIDGNIIGPKILGNSTGLSSFWVLFAILLFGGLFGFVGMVLSMSIYQMSVKEVPASVVAVLFSSNPIFTAVLAFFMLKEPIRRNQIAALLLEIGGILAIINPFHISLSPYGVLLAMISTLLFAVYGVMGKRRCARFGGVVVTCASFLCGGAEMLFMILFSRLPMVNKWLAGSGLELFANIPLLSGYSWNTLPWMLMICIVNTGLGFACYFKAMEETSAQETSLVFFLKPVLAPVFAFFILGEVISWNMGLGIAFILIGSLLALLPGLRAVQKLPKTPGA